MRILIVEDEPKLLRYLKKGLEEESFAVDAVGDGQDALDAAQAAAYDVIVLDVMLPKVDGLEVCRRIRERGQRTPILMLTARDSIPDRVRGLDAGADDYLVKPFAFEELLARIRAAGRRAGAAIKSSVLRAADLSLDTATRRASRGGLSVELPAKEYAVLERLMREPGRVLTRDQIAESVWDSSSYTESNVVDVYIRNLRRKLDDPFGRKLIETVRGAGYRIAEGGSKDEG